MKIALALSGTLFEEALVAAGVLWVLPRLGIRLPLAVIVGLLIAMAGWAVLSYKRTKEMLLLRALSPTEAMVGAVGRALTGLAPKGLVRIRGETWKAVAGEGTLEPGDEVTVLGIEGLTLTVQKSR